MAAQDSSQTVGQHRRASKSRARVIEDGRRAVSFEPSSSGYARCVGRVGALAVALGVGAPIASMPVAFADTTGSGGSTGSSSSSSSSTGALAANPIADFIGIFVGNGTAEHPNGGLLIGNGYSWAGYGGVCTSGACEGGGGGLIGNGGDGFNGGNGGSAFLFGSGGDGGAAA